MSIDEWSRIEVDTLINDRFLVHDYLGEGGFGLIFTAFDKLNNDQPVAIKVAHALLPRQKKKSFSTERKDGSNHEWESSDSSSDEEENMKLFIQKPKRKLNSHLKMEYAVLKHLENIPGFPKVFELSSFGRESYLAMELLGKSVNQVFKDYKKIFSLETILLLTDQLLDRLKNLHEKGIIHGDLSPDNIMLGTGENSGLVYLIDFGFSSMYMDLKTGELLPEKETQITGTPLFMSVNTHRGRQKSRRDDMETLAYVIAYFMGHGNLPWKVSVDESGTDSDEDGHWMQVNPMKMKRNITGTELFGGMPREFAIYLELVKELEYEEQPDYAEYQNLFKRLGTILGVKYDNGSRLSF